MVQWLACRQLPLPAAPCPCSPSTALLPAPCPAPAQERERARTLEQKRGALTILDQLAERERERAAAEEARRREGEAMKARISALKEEEARVSEPRGGLGPGRRVLRGWMT